MTMTETPTAVAPEDEVHTSAMIALMGGPAGAPPDAHITVMYLGDVVDMDEATHAAIVEAVGAIAATTAPFDVMLIGCGIFGDPDEPATVMFAQSDPLADLHDAVEEELELRGVEIDSDYPTWIPHITMGYGIPATPEMVALIGTTVHFDRLTLAWAGDMTDVPFTGVLAPEDDGISMDPTEPADVPGVVPGAAPAPTPPAPTPAMSTIEKEPEAAAFTLPSVIPTVTSGTAITTFAFATSTMVPWEGVLVIEGIASGDGRKMMANSLGWRDLPLPLMAMMSNPVGGGGHDGAFLVGSIQEIVRDGTVLRGRGVINSQLPGANTVLEAINSKSMRGVSVDLDDLVGSIDPTSGALLVQSGRVMGATICAFPAFQEAYLQIDEALVAGGQMHRTMRVFTPIDAWGTESALVASAGAVNRDDLMVPPMAWFTKPELDCVTPLQVTPEGRVFGHVVTWGQCHISFAGKCVTPPSSNSNYRYFRKVGAVLTAEGGMAATGPIFLGGDHAPVAFDVGPARALDHYAATSSAVADVSIYEDQYGIVVAGCIRPDATDAQIRALRASDVSPDWRPIDGTRELVALLAVSCSGLPTPSSNDHLALVASGGIVVAEDLSTGDVGAILGLGTVHRETQTDAFAEMVARLAVLEEFVLPKRAAARRLEALARLAITTGSHE